MTFLIVFFHSLTTFGLVSLYLYANAKFINADIFFIKSFHINKSLMKTKMKSLAMLVATCGGFAQGSEEQAAPKDEEYWGAEKI